MTLQIDSKSNNLFNSLSKSDQEHSIRVKELSLKLAYNFEVNIKSLEIASMFHDIGKIMIKKDILDKKGPLSDIEKQNIMLHAKYTGSILKELGYDNKIIGIAMLHHENYDGTGYPFKMKGVDIPIESRIIRAADVWDALNSKRAYKESFSYDKCKKIMVESEGFFDHNILNYLFDVI